MKMTIEAFDEKKKQYEAKRKEISDSINDLERKKAALDEECKSAVLAGDSDTFIKKTHEKEDISAALFVKRSFLDNMGPAVTEEDAKAAWASYVEGYNKEMQKDLAEYEKDRSALLNKYKGLADKQAAALKVRNHLNEAAGLADAEKSYPMVFIPYVNGVDVPGRVGNMGSGDPDMVFYHYSKEKESGKCFLRLPNAPISTEQKDVSFVMNVVKWHKVD